MSKVRKCNTCGVEKDIECYRSYAKGVIGRCKQCEEDRYNDNLSNRALAIQTGEQKKCKGCSVHKTYDLFPSNKKLLSGINTTCKQCTNAKQKIARDSKVKVTEITIESYVCCTCSVYKPISEFYKDRATKTGMRARCKECDNKTSAKRRERNR